MISEISYLTRNFSRKPTTLVVGVCQICDGCLKLRASFGDHIKRERYIHEKSKEIKQIIFEFLGVKID